MELIWGGAEGRVMRLRFPGNNRTFQAGFALFWCGVRHVEVAC
jgi:hypothetical protein